MAQRFGIYCRVSTDEQEEGYSHESQERLCREYLRDHGIDLAEDHVYHETFSGRYWDERPLMRSLMLAVKRHDIDGVVAFKLDRVSRDQTHLGVFFHEMKRAGAEFALVAEPYDNSPEGQLLLNVRGYVATVELATTRYRTMLGREARAKKGFYPGVPKAPYGFQFVPDTKPPRSVLEHNPEEVKVLWRIRDELVAGGSLRQVCLRLTAEGVPTPGRSSAWASASVRKMLDNPIYLGKPAVYRVAQHRGARGKWESQRRDPSEYVWLPEVPPVWSEADLALMRSRLQTNKREAKRNNKHAPHALLRAGIGRCAYCGNSLNLRSTWYTKKSGERVPYSQYCCSPRNRDRYQCPGHSIRSTSLDDEVWRQVLAKLRDEDFVKAIEQERGREEQADGITALRERIQAVHAEAERLLNEDLKELTNATSRKLVMQQIDALGQQEEELRDMLDQRAQEYEQRELARQKAFDVQRMCAAMSVYGEALPLERRRDYLKALSVRVFLWGTDHEERWAARLRLLPHSDVMPWITASGAPLCDQDRMRLERYLQAGERTSLPSGVSFVETTSCRSSHNCMPAGMKIAALECDDRELTVFVEPAA